MKITTTKQDHVWNYLGTFFRMGSSFLLLPFLLVFLSEDELGLWYVFLAISSFVTLFQSGFVPSFARNVAYCWSGASCLSKNGLNRDSVSSEEISYRLFMSIVIASRRLYRLIAAVSFVALLSAGSLYVISVSGDLPAESIMPSWGIFCIAVFLNLAFSYYESLLRGVGNLPGINKALIVSSAGQVVISGAMLAVGFGVFSCAVAFLFQGLLYRLLCRHYFLSYENVREIIEFEGIGKHEVTMVLKAVYPNAMKDTVVSLANYAVTTANTVLCSALFSITATGSFSVMLQLVSAVASLASVAISTNQPSLQSAFARGDKESEKTITAKTTATFVFLYLIGVILVTFVVIPVVCVLRPSFQCDYLLLLAMMAYIFLWRQHSMSAAFITNTNELPYMWAFVISSAAGIALAIALGFFTDLGLYSLVIGPGLAQLVYNNWKWPHEAARRLGESYFGLLKNGFKLLLKR